MPADIQASLAKLLIDAIGDPSNKEALEKQGLTALAQDPAAFNAYIAKDRERWAKVVKAGNIKAE
jgi:tripartite-type tricarboxylate transporter receptor subunit TctC